MTGHIHHSHSLSAVSVSHPPSCPSDAPIAQAELAFSEEMGDSSITGGPVW